jgi:uncharacterized small protein (DUF1192 family)
VAEIADKLLAALYARIAELEAEVERLEAELYEAHDSAEWIGDPLADDRASNG